MKVKSINFPTLESSVVYDILSNGAESYNETPNLSTKLLEIKLDNTDNYISLRHNSHYLGNYFIGSLNKSNGMDIKVIVYGSDHQFLLPEKISETLINDLGLQMG